MSGMRLEVFENNLVYLTKIMDKIEAQLEIQSFLDLVKFLEKLYLNILAQEIVGHKILAFMDGLTKFSVKGGERKILSNSLGHRRNVC